MSHDSELSHLEDQARDHFDEKFAAREVGLRNSRQAIRRCANAIRSVHRSEFSSAEDLMAEAQELLAQARLEMSAHPDVHHAGFYNDACKEYAEARITAAIISGAPIPSPNDLDVSWAPYLNGLGEVVGELRRHLLDQLRLGDIERGELMLDRMSEILDLLTALDYPDGMTGGLRRTTDVARALIERSRADLTNTVVQERLIAQIRRSQES